MAKRLKAGTPLASYKVVEDSPLESIGTEKAAEPKQYAGLLRKDRPMRADRVASEYVK
jgi:hypothetical protein